MENFLDPVRQVLDELAKPADIFFRDDDAGWEDRRLMQLLDLFEHFELPIDLAAIPHAMTNELGRKLLQRMSGNNGNVGVHQHGYAHLNHEKEGRKCEFGASRNRAQQREDIRQGQGRLQQFLGAELDSIFTPPWNRCTVETGECLVELGFAALSRESGAEPLNISGLAELPVTQDWFAHRKGIRLTPLKWGESLAAKLNASTPVGIMFHHAVMDQDEMNATAELLELLRSHASAHCHSMRELVPTHAGR